MPHQSSFHVLRTSDAEMFDSLSDIISDGAAFTVSRIDFIGLDSQKHSVTPKELKADDFLQAVCQSHARAFQRIELHYQFANVQLIRGERSGSGGFADKAGHLDEVMVTISDEQFKTLQDKTRVLRLLTHCQKHFQKYSPSSIQAFLTEDAKRHFEARDSALAKLEEVVARFATELTKKSEEIESRAEERRAKLNEEFTAKQDASQLELKEQREALDQRASNLDEREKQLNLEAPKAERRKVFDDLRETLKDWDEKFSLSTKTNQKRIPTVATFVALMLFLGGLTIYFSRVASTAELPDGQTGLWSATYVTRAMKPILTLAVLLSVCVYAIKWFNSWADRHAAEEFRLKRLQLDLQRAHWFTELAFQWKDEFEEPIPNEMAERLAAGLFVTSDEEHEHPTYESLASILFGAASSFKLSPHGVEVEMPGKKLRKLAKKTDEQTSSGKADQT